MDPNENQDHGYLTEEEVEALNLGDEPGGEEEPEEPKAETGEDGDPPAPAEGEEGEDEPDGGKEVTNTEPGEDPGEPEKKPVILAKDGIHTIPYEELETERRLRQEAERRLQDRDGGKPDDPPAAPEDKFADFRKLTRTELHELKNVSEGDELERILEFEEVLADERVAARNVREQAQSRIDSFMQEHEITEGSAKQRHLNRMFQEFQQDGLDPLAALDRVKDEMVELGMIAKPEGSTSGSAPTPEEVARRAKRAEAAPVAPRTLADTGTPAAQAPVSIDDMDVEEAEAALASMSAQERAKLLGDA